jgi:hypothetical protein
MGKRKIELKLITDKKVRYVRSDFSFFLPITDMLQQAQARLAQKGHGAGDADRRALNHDDI